MIQYPYNTSLRSAVTVLYAFQALNAKPAVARLIPGQAIMIWDPSGDGKVTREVSILRTVVETLEVRKDDLSDEEYESFRRKSGTWIRPAGATEALMTQDAVSVAALAEPSFATITRVGADRPLFGAYPRDTRSNKKAAEWGPVTGAQFVSFWHNTGAPAQGGMMLPCVGVLSGTPGEGFPFQVRAMEPETAKYATKWFKPLALAAPGVNKRMDRAEFEMNEQMVEMAVRRKQRLFLAWVPFGPLKPPSIEFVSDKPINHSPKAAESWAEEQGNEAVRRMANELGCPAAAKLILEWDALTPEEHEILATKDARDLVEMLRELQATTAASCYAASTDPVTELPPLQEPAEGVAKLESAARYAVASQCFNAPVGADLSI